MLERMKLDIAFSLQQLLSKALNEHWLHYTSDKLQITDTCGDTLVSENELEKMCIDENLHEEFLLCGKLYREVGGK